MFDSGVSTSNLISELYKEIDVAIPISDETYIAWINEIERLLYREIIQEQQMARVDFPEEGEIDLSAIVISDNEDTVRFEDIHAVYVGRTQLIKTTAASGQIFPDCYYKVNDNLCIHADSVGDEVTIVYFAKPKLKTVDDDNNIMVPVEFLELVKAKLRANAYMLVNEFGIAGNWLSTYNVLIENFKQWMASKMSNFGL